jgi:hypothetical protein
MKESATYRAVVREGIIEGEQRVLLLLGEPKFGPADETTRAVIKAIHDPAKLEELLLRLPQAQSWQQLLPRPADLIGGDGLRELLAHLAGVDKGRIEGARRLLLLQGEAKFGPPNAATRRAIEALEDLTRLEELGLRLIEAATWQELLPRSPQHRRNRRRQEAQ